VAEHGFVLQYSLRMGCKRELRAHGKCFIGTVASMVLDRSGYSIVKEVPAGQKAVPTGSLINPEETVTATDWNGRTGDDLHHFEMFLANVRERKEPFANLETCHQASNLGHLMNIAWQAGRSIRWDGKKEQVISDPRANALVMKPYRAPWKLVV
jgi:hypothetical protein